MDDRDDDGIVMFDKMEEKIDNIIPQLPLNGHHKTW